MKDLTIMVPDKHIEAVVNSLLERLKGIEIKEISWETTVDTNRAPGCANNGVENLSMMGSMFRHALLIFRL